MTPTTLLRALGRADWLRHGLRNRLVYAGAKLFPPADTKFTVDFFGQAYPGDLRSLIDAEVFYFGGYELTSLALLRGLARRMANPVFADIGANVGHHTLFMSRFASAVHCFEPYEPLQSLIREKIEVNGLADVHLHPVGLGERDEELTFSASTTANKGTGSFVPTHNATNRPVGKLAVRRGDTYFAAHGIVGANQLWKIDVEGFERFVLRGLRETLQTVRPLVLMEYSGTTASQFPEGETLSVLLPENYEIHSIRGDRAHMVFLNRHDVELCAFDPSAESDLLLVPAERRSLVLDALPETGARTRGSTFLR